MMLRSVALRRLCVSSFQRYRRFPSQHFSTGASSQPVPPPPQPQFPSNTVPPPPLQPSQRPEPQQNPAASATSASSSASAAEEEIRRERSARAKGGEYEDGQARVLRAALNHVVKLGWSESAMILGARDVGVSPSIIGSFPRKEAALVEFFMDDCLQRLIDRIDSGEELEGLMLSERLSKLVRMRLEMQAPYISKWPQALSIQAQPTNFPTSFKQRAMLIDEIWHAAAAGDQASDFDWYVKRTVLGGIYSTTEVFMLTDHSPEFRDTWVFLDRRIKDAFDVQKTLQEAAYLAEAVGAGVGKSMEGFMKKLFQG